jgi:hypothetical protein
MYSNFSILPLAATTVAVASATTVAAAAARVLLAAVACQCTRNDTANGS